MGEDPLVLAESHSVKALQKFGKIRIKKCHRVSRTVRMRKHKNTLIGQHVLIQIYNDFFPVR
jgi:hypothetical protein